MTALPAPAALADAPPEIAEEVRAWAKPLLAAAGDAFHALYVYGSALAPGFDPAVSDINILLVLTELPFARLDALAKVFADPATVASGGHRYTPVLFTVAQIA